MKKLSLVLSLMFSALAVYSQNTGLGTKTPGTTLDVNGAITNRETIVTVSGNAATIPANVSQVQLNGGATANITVAAPAPPNAGQRLIIYNNTTGGFPALLNSIPIPMGQAMEFSYSNGDWRGTNGGATAIATNTFWNTTGNTGTSAANFIGTTDATDFILRTSNTEKVRLRTNGELKFTGSAVRKIVFGETTPINDNLFVGIGVNSNPPFYVNMRYQVLNNAAAHVFYAGNTATTSDELMRISGLGRVGIGNAAPTNKLHVNGTDPLRLEGVQPSVAAGDAHLVIDATGVVKTALTAAPTLIVNATGGTDVTAGTGTTANGNIPNNVFFPVVLTEVLDAANQYNPATGTFTAAADGLYFINTNFNFITSGGAFDGNGGKLWGAYLLNGAAASFTSFTSILKGSTVAGGVNYHSANTTLTLYLKAGNMVQLGCFMYGVNNVVDDLANLSTQNGAANKPSFVKVYKLQ